MVLTWLFFRKIFSHERRTLTAHAGSASQVKIKIYIHREGRFRTSTRAYPVQKQAEQPSQHAWGERKTSLIHYNKDHSEIPFSEWSYRNYFFKKRYAAFSAQCRKRIWRHFCRPKNPYPSYYRVNTFGFDTPSRKNICVIGIYPIACKW